MIGPIDLLSSRRGPDPASADGYREHPRRMGFFTDTSVCIGCKACEVACKEWNHVPEDGLEFTGMSYDNTKGLGADTWRHVKFIEQRKPLGRQEPGLSHQLVSPISFGGYRRLDGHGEPGPSRSAPNVAAPGGATALGTATAGVGGPIDFRWLMASDVCKHCTDAGCLDVCPTGALFRTEFGTVVVQEDVCNGCGYCVPACPFGVLDKREEDGRIWKCTLCYDRLSNGDEPACAKTCPTSSIQFGELDELRERAGRRVQQLHDGGILDARLYLESPDDGVGGAGAFFLLLDEPEVYGLPPDPVVPTRDLPRMWKLVGAAAGALLAAGAASFAGAGRSAGRSSGAES